MQQISSSCCTLKTRSSSLDRLVEILKQSAFEESEGSEPEPEEKTLTVLKLNDLFCLNDAGIKAFEIIY
jgi:hypothetical protein